MSQYKEIVEDFEVPITSIYIFACVLVIHKRFRCTLK